MGREIARVRPAARQYAVKLRQVHAALVTRSSKPTPLSMSVPENDQLVVATRCDVDSVVLQRRISYLAFVPQKALREDEKLPVLYLLHGEDGAWTDFSARARAVLQTLARSTSSSSSLRELRRARTRTAVRWRRAGSGRPRCSPS